MTSKQHLRKTSMLTFLLGLPPIMLFSQVSLQKPPNRPNSSRMLMQEFLLRLNTAMLQCKDHCNANET